MKNRLLAPAVAVSLAAGSIVAVNSADAQEFTAAELYEPSIGSTWNVGPDEKRAYLINGEGPRATSLDLNLFESPYPGLKMELDTSPYSALGAVKLRLEGGKIYPDSFDVLVGVTVHYDDGSSEYVEGPFTVNPLKALVAGTPATPVSPTTTPRATVSVTMTATEYFPEPYPEFVTETETATVTKTLTETTTATETETDWYPEPYPEYVTETVTATTTETEFYPEYHTLEPAPEFITETVTETVTKEPEPGWRVEPAPATVTKTVQPSEVAIPKVRHITTTTTVPVTETATVTKVVATPTTTVVTKPAENAGSSIGTGGVIGIILGVLAALGIGAVAGRALPPEIARALPF